MVDKKFVGLKEVFPLSHIAYKPLGLKWTRAMRECMCEATAYMSFFQSKQQTINLLLSARLDALPGGRYQFWSESETYHSVFFFE